ncbi:TIGR03067 domain-containing protein [Rhodopirellula baltica]
MSPNSIIVLLLSLLSTGSFVCAQDTQSHIEALEGSWAVVGITANGELVPREELIGFKFRFSKKELVWLSPDGEKVDEFTIKLDTSQKPLAIEMVETREEDGKKHEKTTLAIIDLKHDKLRICMPPRGEAKRPKSFESKNGSFLSLIVLERIKSSTSDTGRTKP